MRFCLTVLAACALPLVGAQAADLAAKAPVYKAPIVAVYDWTGFYVGANGGGGWQDGKSAIFTPNDTLLAFILGGPPPASFRMSGALGGVQAGYNWQFNPNWVVGVEADFDGSDIKGSTTVPFLGVGGLAPQLYDSTAAEQVRWFGTVRARLGFLPTRNLLIYGTGGFAYGKVDQSANILNVGGTTVGVGETTCVGFTICYAGASSRIATGWTAGGGGEYALSRNWTLRAEYLYVNLGRNSFPEVVVAPGPVDSFTASFNPTAFHVVRGAVNYRF